MSQKLKQYRNDKERREHRRARFQAFLTWKRLKTCMFCLAVLALVGLLVALGMDAFGVPSDPRRYGGQLYRDLREVLAQDKDFLYCLVQPKPTYLGEAIPVQGNGNLTNDKNDKKN